MLDALFGDVFNQILCWIRQIGAMVLNALVGIINLAVEAVADAAIAVLAEWPISMPGLPTVPEQLGEAWAWVKWTPLPVTAGAAFLAFYFTCVVAWMGASVLMRWLKVID